MQAEQYCQHINFHPLLLARCQKSWYLIVSEPSNHMLCCLYI